MFPKINGNLFTARLVIHSQCVDFETRILAWWNL